MTSCVEFAIIVIFDDAAKVRLSITQNTNVKYSDMLESDKSYPLMIVDSNNVSSNCSKGELNIKKNRQGLPMRLTSPFSLFFRCYNFVIKNQI